LYAVMSFVYLIFSTMFIFGNRNFLSRCIGMKNRCR